MDFLCWRLKDNLIQNFIIIWNINAPVIVALLQNKERGGKGSEVAA